MDLFIFYNEEDNMEYTTITSVGNVCNHENGYYKKVYFWIFYKTIFVCEDCRDVVYKREDNKMNTLIKKIIDESTSKKNLNELKKETFGYYDYGNHAHMNKTPNNSQEANRHGNALAASGNYPAGTNDCFNVGISGGCGSDCFVFKNGDCEFAK